MARADEGPSFPAHVRADPDRLRRAEEHEARRQAAARAWLDRVIVGSRFSRIARRPHEIRVHLLGDAANSVWLAFRPARDAVVDLLEPDARISHVTDDVLDGRHEVRLWSDDRVVLSASARRWSFHMYDAAVEGGLWLLTDEEKAAVHRAVAAVVTRDTATVATMLDDDQDGPVEDFWTWVDTHWPADTPTGEPRSPARLLMPPPPVEDWEADVNRDGAGGHVGVVVDFLDADAPEHPTDLSLELTLVHTPDGHVRVEVQAPHVM